MTRPDPTGDQGAKQEPRSSNIAATVDALRHFDDRGPRRLALIGLGAFVTGTSEAAVLALITAAAVATTDAADASPLGPLDLTPSQSLTLAAACLAVNVASGLAVARGSSQLAAHAGLAARQRLLGAYFRASYSQKASRRVANLQDRLTTHVDRFLQAFGSLTQLLTAALSLASFAISAFVIDPVALIALALIGILASGVQRPIAVRTKRSAKQLARQRGHYAEAATESVLLAREMAVFGAGDVAGERMLDLDRGVAKHFARTRFLSLVNVRLYQGLALGLVLLGLAFIGNRGTDDLAGIAAVALILLRSLSYGQTVLATVQSLAEERPFIDDLVALIDEYERTATHHGDEKIDRIERIDLVGVGFAYAGQPALVDVDLSIGAAETIGIVGPSGAGKTTLVNLLLRLYEPTSGTITVNGAELRDVAPGRWHEMTAIVPQEPRLLSGTVADNIRFFRDLDDEAVERAAEGAHLAAYVRSLPRAFDAPIAELGQNLSGGQRQRLCIARALAGDPQLLVLDEPTSALDGESEAAIQAALTELKGRVAMVLVAHRLSTLSICDRIVVVDRGMITDVGTPAELQSRSGYFRDAMTRAGLR